MFVSKTQITVRYYETDMMGVVHHSNFLRYLETARTHYMKELGYSYAETEKEGILFMVISTQQEFKGNVSYDDVITVHTNMASFKGARFYMEYEIFSGEKLIHKAVTGHGVTDKNLRPVNLAKVNAKLYETMKNACREQQT